MKKLLRIIGAGALLLLAACAAKSVPATEIPENLPGFDAELAKGKIFTSALPIPGSPARLGKVIGMINAPPALVWKIVTHYEQYVEFMPLVVDSRVEQIGPTTCKLYQKYKLKIGGINFGAVIPVSYWVELKMNHNPRLYHIDWDMTAGDIKNTYGSWDLQPFGPGGNQTKLTYQLYFEVGNALIDGSAKFLDEEVLPLVIKSLRDRVLNPLMVQLDVPACAQAPEAPTLDEDVKKAFQDMELQ